MSGLKSFLGIFLLNSLNSLAHSIRLHIQQLSSVECLPVIQEARDNGLDVTAETCFHYLTIPSQEIDDAQTQYKCAPPIRSNDNRIRMWRAVRDGEINLLASSHNPATPEDKGLVYGRDRGNFFTSWPGVASLQLGEFFVVSLLVPSIFLNF